MPYAQRDGTGKIVALFDTPTEQAPERVSAGDPELTRFLRELESEETRKQLLSLTDTELARVVEDLVELLVDKQVILFTELPSVAQQKLLNRKRVRMALHGEQPFIVDEKDIL